MFSNNINDRILDDIRLHYDIGQADPRGFYNFRCPLCGDGENGKTRGWILKKHDRRTYHCFNCGESISIVSLAKHLIPSFDINDYRDKNLLEGLNRHIREKREENILNEEDEIAGVDFNFTIDHIKINYPSLFSLDMNHPAKQYLIKRRVPFHKMEDIFFINDVSQFEEIFNKMSNTERDYSNIFNQCKDVKALCFPYYDREGKYQTLQLRLFNMSLRFLILRLNDDYNSDVLGLKNIDMNEDVIICEGTIDSLMFDNMVSSTSHTSMINTANKLIDNHSVDKNKIHLVYDRDFMINQDVKSQLEKAIENGFNVYLYDDIVGYSVEDIKDLNDIVVHDILSPNKLKENILNNSCEGLLANMKLMRMGI